MRTDRVGRFLGWLLATFGWLAGTVGDDYGRGTWQILVGTATAYLFGWRPEVRSGRGSWFDRGLKAREALRNALAEVWSGADFTDTDAVLDQLDDRGYRVVRK